MIEFDQKEQAILRVLVKKAKAKRKRNVFDKLDNHPPLTNPTQQLPSNKQWRSMAKQSWIRVPFKRCLNCDQGTLFRTTLNPDVIWCYTCGDQQYVPLQSRKARSKRVEKVSAPSHSQRS